MYCVWMVGEVGGVQCYIFTLTSHGWGDKRARKAFVLVHLQIRLVTLNAPGIEAKPTGLDK